MLAVLSSAHGWIGVDLLTLGHPLYPCGTAISEATPLDTAGSIRSRLFLFCGWRTGFEIPFRTPNSKSRFHHSLNSPLDKSEDFNHPHFFRQSLITRWS